MTKEDKRLLLRQAIKLATLGSRIERERSRLNRLVEQGVSLSDPRMLKAYGRFMQSATEWQILEAEHLKLRKKFEHK